MKRVIRIKLQLQFQFSFTRITIDSTFARMVPTPMPDCTLRDRTRLSALHHDPLALAALPLVSRRTASCGRRKLAEFRTANHSTFQNIFSSTLLRASGVSRVPEVHSPKESWWKMSRASAPPWETPPSGRIAAVRAAISLSRSDKSRLETRFHTNFPSGVGRTSLGV